MGAVAGGAVGAYGGHKVNHGFLGTIGGAITGSLAEDALKKHKKDKIQQQCGPRPPNYNSSSSSSSYSSSDDNKKKHKRKNDWAAPAAGAAVVGGAGAYGVHQHHKHHSHISGGGNFSSSCHSITLDREYVLVATCRTSVHGQYRVSSLPLNSCLSNKHGQFVWSRSGNFAASARNVRLVENGRVLEAELWTASGSWNKTYVRLDERISNNAGDLVFLG